MNDAIKAILEDKKTYPDTHRIAMGNGLEMTAGDFRRMWADRETALATRQAELDQRWANVEKAQNEASTLYATVVDLQERLKAAGGNPGAPPPNPNNPSHIPGIVQPTEDPYASFYGYEGPVGDMAKFLRQREAMSAQAIGAILRALQDTQRMFHQYRYQTEYDTLLPQLKDEKGNAPSPADLLKAANDEKLVDEFNVPSLRRAASKIIESRRLAKEKKEEYDRGIEEGKKLAQAAQPSQPGPALERGNSMFRSEPIKSGDSRSRDPLGDAIREAAADKDLWSGINIQQ